MEMIEVKTSELIGPALDWAVAKATDTKIDDSRGKELRIDVGAGFQSPWIPSVNWHQIGPLIEKYRVEFTFERAGLIFAELCEADGSYTKLYTGTFGPNYLVAACRAIVASKLGDTVSVPRELMQ